MRAELLKIRSMPTPLWTGVFMAACFVVGAIFCVFKGVGQENAVLDIAIGLPGMIAAIVIGAWLVGVEFGQNTLRRTLSADSRRTRLAFAKLGAGLAVVAGVTVILWLLGMLIFPLAGSGHETTIDTAQAFRGGAAVLMTNLVYATTAMGLAWITRSMAGGMTIALVFFFVIDSMLVLIPKVGQYAFGMSVSRVDQAIRGGSESGLFGSDIDLTTTEAVFSVAIWVTVVFTLGVIRTKYTEVK